MKDAFNTIMDILVSTGISEYDAEGLLARFLQEDAFDYVETIMELLDNTELNDVYMA